MTGKCISFLCARKPGSRKSRKDDIKIMNQIDKKCAPKQGTSQRKKNRKKVLYKRPYTITTNNSKSREAMAGAWES